MKFFATPYHVHFDDTMAYGTHHFLTNFRFQCFAREEMYFSDGPTGERLWKNDSDVVLLTYEGYSKNLAPVALGERVAVFLSMGGGSEVSTYLFFRVVRYDGVPVCCGFQRAVSTSRTTGELIDLPPSVAQFLEMTAEREEANTFIAGAMETGGRRALNKLFPPALLTAAVRMLEPGVWSADTPYAEIDEEGGIRFSSGAPARTPSA